MARGFAPTALQYGEGNFIRAFADWMLDIALEKGAFHGGVCMVKPRPGSLPESFKQQGCSWHVLLRGLTPGEDGTPKPVQSLRRINVVKEALSVYTDYARVMDCAFVPQLRFILSNTTEAGLTLSPDDRLDDKPPASFPAKLTKFMHARWKHFGGSPDKGLIVLPLELIDNNGHTLRSLVLTLCERWGLEPGFVAWLQKSCCFANTLVDRIVSGRPADADAICAPLGKSDPLLDAAEPYALWVIEAPHWVRDELPLHRIGLPVLYTDDIKPYKMRKVRILNGAHTSLVPVAYLLGHRIVREALGDEAMMAFVQQTIEEEIIPTLDFPRAELQSYASDVIARFCNPYIDHKLLAISLNSVSKWRARCLPTLCAYAQRFEALPKRLTFSLAALLAFYTGGGIENGVLVGREGGESYPLADEESVLAFFAAHLKDDPATLTDAFLRDAAFLGRYDALPVGFGKAVAADLAQIRSQGMAQTFAARFPGRA